MEDNLDGMPLTKVVKEWMTGKGWEDEININEERTNSTIASAVSINDQAHNFFFEIHEARDQFAVFIYSPYKVPPARMSDMARLLNRINNRLNIGRLACMDDEDANNVQFKGIIDVEGGRFGGSMIGNLYYSGINTFEYYGDLLAAAAMTKQPIERLWSEFLEQEAAREAAKEEADDGTPTEL
jgi:hypothetical protein